MQCTRTRADGRTGGATRLRIEAPARRRRQNTTARPRSGAVGGHFERGEEQAGHSTVVRITITSRTETDAARGHRSCRNDASCGRIDGDTCASARARRRAVCVPGRCADAPPVGKPACLWPRDLAPHLQQGARKCPAHRRRPGHWSSHYVAARATTEVLARGHDLQVADLLGGVHTVAWTRSTLRLKMVGHAGHHGARAREQREFQPQRDLVMQRVRPPMHRH
jgi:hypothetical protein